MSNAQLVRTFTAFVLVLFGFTIVHDALQGVHNAVAPLGLGVGMLLVGVGLGIYTYRRH